MAIIHVLSIELEPFKREDALAWIKDINAHLESIGLKPARTLAPSFGADLDRIVWTWDFDSLAEHEEEQNKRSADPGVQERIQKMAGVFKGGSLHSQIFQDLL